MTTKAEQEILDRILAELKSETVSCSSFCLLSFFASKL
jgi:hypothetical protein